LVLYTDGLVERRGRGIDVGLELLVGQVRTLGRDGGPSLSATLLHALDDSDHSDDVCLLAAVVGDCST
jgi:serine/threonine-protein kinase RsbW